MSFIYLASPYTSPSSKLLEERFQATEKAVADYLNKGVYVYSPIVHCHELAKRHKLPTDFSFWVAYNYAMLDAASELYVFMLPGWASSTGVTAEIARAALRNIPIRYVEPGIPPC